MEVVKNRVYFYMGQFNEYVRGFHMDLVFFHDALVHLMIVSRIISMPRYVCYCRVKVSLKLFFISLIS